MTAGQGRESAKSHSRQRVLSTTGLNFHAGGIGLAHFRNFDGADIGKEIGGEIARDLMGDGSQRLVVFPAFDRKTQAPGVERRATFGANDDI